MRDSRVSGRGPAIIAHPPRQRHDSPLNAQLDEIGRHTRDEHGLPAYSDPAIRGRLTEILSSWLDAQDDGKRPGDAPR
jgi:hypothetical protein